MLMSVSEGEFRAFEFEKSFTALTTHDPFAWQRELYQQFIAGNPPDVCDVPTGLGKTSVMDLWLLALAWEALHWPTARVTPTRLLWVVDRRVVVDQATVEAESLASKIASLPEDDELRQGIAGLSIRSWADGPLAVSTLRGERADNRAWSLDPSRPAIIVGTVDMIGSRLLFSGYGDSRRRRAMHAGLLGRDTLIVNDEAHLTPAFAALVERLRELSGGARPLRTMLLTATQRDGTRAAFPTGFEADLTSEIFRKRYRAIKRLRLIEHEDHKKVIQDLACKPDRRTIVFVRSPKDAQKTAVAIEKANPGAAVPRLTGMQRGKERDELLQDAVVQRFLRGAAVTGEPCWLVATSAGEVGIDLSADRLITDLDTADHLLQRFGRLNRFGETEGDAYVVYADKQVKGDKADARLKSTLDYLGSLPGISPEALRVKPPPAEALSPEPKLAPLLPWHIDVWSMTSISSREWPSRPPVEYWLHGDDEKGSPPETYVAWREDVADLVGASERDREEVFDCYPILARERLKQYTGRVTSADFKQPWGLCDELAESAHLGSPALLIAVDGEVRAGALKVLLEDRHLFRYATLVLPPGVGHLDSYGMVDWSKAEDDLERYDVSETSDRRRIKLNSGQEPPETGLRLRYTLELATEDESEEGGHWLYFVGKVAGRSTKPAPEFLSSHQEQVAPVAADLARRLDLDDSIIRVMDWAGRWHDAGKSRELWQRAAGNGDGGPSLAKSPRVNGRLLDGYRHELGSLLDAEFNVPPDFTPEERDLALHLIASHHGWARPHFTERTFDKGAYRRSESAALEGTRRFGRLQRRYGAWGLAYLEAVFRSADALASEGSWELPVNA